VSLTETSPAPEEQLAFLAKLQRLFSEGDFTATYKFALLIALADLAVESNSHGAEPLPLSIRQIAHRFILMYWHHAREYGVGRANTKHGVLVQNLGTQAAVITHIRAFQMQYPRLTLAQAAATPVLRGLITKIAATVANQPVEYLQNFGGTTDPFLYSRVPGGVELRPGVTYCLRRFYPLIQQLSRAGWMSHIKSNSRNQQILGAADDLEEFLFHTSRQSLALIGERLRKLDGARCFYCSGGLQGADVDHYVPFSLYPRDLAHNFVLAHPTCNRSKSNTLAGRMHLERWLERLQKQASQLSEIGREAGIMADLGVTRGMARWAYEAAVTTGAHAWIARDQFEVVDQSYLTLEWIE
jgi:5-methylcytosine-specific restriction endonuclease McrA